MSDSIIGTRIGIFDVLYECDYKANDGHRLYRVKCVECGYEVDMQKRHINTPTKCTHLGVGGRQKQYNYVWNHPRLKSIFSGMKTRCYNPDDKEYPWYGARGIKICNEWLNNPKSFEEWALLNGYDDTLTINRKDENKDYCPENCEWITLEDNAKYKSTTSLIDVDGEIHTGKDWARILGLGENRINIYIREYGLDNTIEFIRRYQNNPNLKPKHKQSYYNLYMNQNSVNI